MTRRSFLQVLAATALAPAGCNLTPEPPIRVGASIWPGYECLFIARSLGLYSTCPVKLVEYPNTPEVIRAFRNRTIELAALSADEFLRLAAELKDLRAILVMDISKGADVVIGQPGLATVQDLRGKRVGVEVNALGVYFLARALGSVGLRTSDIETVPLDNDQHIAAFSQGHVDAVVTFEPHRTKLLKQGGRVVFDSSRIYGDIVDYLVTTETVLEERSSAVRKVLEGWFKARERLMTESEDVARLVTSREGVTVPEFLSFLDLLEIPSLGRNRQLLGSSEKCLASLKNTHAAMVESGLFRGDLPGGKLFDGGYLP